MSSRTPTLVASLGALAVLSLACSDGSGPSKPKGMSGTWLVTTGAMDETNTGRGTCQLNPASFTMTVDSASHGVGVTLPPATTLSCSSGEFFDLTPYDSLTWAYSPPDSVRIALFLVDSTTTNEVVIFAWSTIGDDSIGGELRNQNDQGFLPLGQSIWSAVRQ